MRRKNLWLRLSSCTMAALIATTSVVPAAAAEVDFQDEAFVDGEETDQAEVPEETAEVTGEGETAIDEAAPEEAETATSEEVDLATEENAAPAEEVTENQTEEAGEAEFAVEDVFSHNEEETSQETDATEPANEAETTGNAFGTAGTTLEKGTYTLKASLMKGNDPASASMAGSCIAGDATMVVAEDGSATVTVPIQAVSVYGMTGNAEQWKIYKGDLKTETVDASFTNDENGKVNSITFTIPDKSLDGVYVNMYIDLMQTTQDAFLKLDYANAQAVKPAVDTTALEETIAKADALVETSYTKASWDGNKDAIETAKTAAKEALGKKESQEAVDAANTALTDAISKLVKAGNQTSLKKVLEQAKSLDENDYTEKTWTLLKTAIDKADVAIENRETSRNLSSARSALNTYISNLKLKYDPTDLEKVIAEAEALKEEDYTEESWKEANLAKAINSAKSAIAAREDKDGIRNSIKNVQDAMDKLVANGVLVGRGDFAKKLTPGTYSLPIELLNGSKATETNQYTSTSYMTAYLSMAAGCFTDKATLVIHEDGSATLTTGLTSIEAMGLTGAASDWTIYENTQDYLDGTANSSKGARYKARVDKTAVLGGKRKPSVISFTIPDLKQNVVATRMYIEVMKTGQDACIGLDWANITKVSDNTSATSPVDREYVVKADTLTQLKEMKDGVTVKLDEDVTLTNDLTVKGGTIDLNGHTLDVSSNILVTKGDVTVIDSSDAKNGKIASGKYNDGSETSTSISVQKGTFKAEGITIDGQIGNRLYTNGQYTLNSLPAISVILDSCTLTNTTGASDTKNIYFENLENGLTLTVNGCTLDNGILIRSNKQTTINIANCTITNGAVQITGASSASVTETKASQASTIGADEMTIKKDEFGGLTIMGSGDVELEDVTSVATSYGSALTFSGSGNIVVKSGVYRNDNGYAVSANGYKMMIEGGYFLGKTGVVNGAYDTPGGKVLGEVKEGEYAGYQTVVDGTKDEVNDSVATIYNADGSVARQIGKDNIRYALNYTDSDQILKLNTDIEVNSLTFFKNCTLDLNGHVLKLDEALYGKNGTCRIVDSSAEKTGKYISAAYVYVGQNERSVLILDDISCEGLMLQGMSTGSIYISNGTKVSGVFALDAVLANGKEYVQDSEWTIAETDYDGNAVDAKALLENAIRTSQYTITEIGNRTFKVTANEVGKAMRAFEALDASAYTKTSYAAAKAVYDEIDGSADEDIQGEVVAQKAKELNDAIANLQAPATEASVNALKSAITAAKKLKSTDYTAASFKTYTAAITAAEKVLEGEELSETEVTEATKALTAAKAKLIKMQAQTITISANNSNGVISKKYGDKAFSLGAKAKTGLTYKSSNTKIATVDSKGNVTIKAAGTVTITIAAKATENYNAATRTVTVKIAKVAQAQSITVSVKNSNGVISRKYGDKAFSLGAKAKTGLTYKSSNTKVATVDSKGNVTIKAAGTATITITAKATQDYKAATRTVTVKVAKVQKAQSITVSVKNSNGVISRKYGDKAFSLGAKAKTGLTYKSSNTKIATVDGKGNVTIKAPGTVKITITAKASGDYKTAAKTLTVKIAKKNATIKTKTSAKTIKYATLKKKAQVFTLGVSVNSKGALTYKKLFGSSAITVNSKNGKLTVKKGLKKGTYKVKVQIKSAAKGNYNAGSKTVTVTVKVK